MNSRIQRINKIIQLAESEMDQAAKTMIYLRNKLQSEDQQLQSLTEYLDEYAASFSNSGSFSSMQLISKNAFSDKLIQAIAVQKKQVEESEKMAELAEQEWNQKRIRLKALQALLQRLRKQHQIRLTKQEQRLLDELSAHKYSIKNS
jgi:flagellar FliJ protein